MLKFIEQFLVLTLLISLEKLGYDPRAVRYL